MGRACAQLYTRVSTRLRVRPHPRARGRYIRAIGKHRLHDCLISLSVLCERGDPAPTEPHSCRRPAAGPRPRYPSLHDSDRAGELPSVDR